MQEQLSLNSFPVTGRSAWRYFVAGFTALLTLSLVAVGLAMHTDPQVVVVRSEFATPSASVDGLAAGSASTPAGVERDEVRADVVVTRAKAVASLGSISLDRIAPDPTATPVPAPTATAVPATAVPTATAAPTATAVPATAVPTATAAPTAAPAAGGVAVEAPVRAASVTTVVSAAAPVQPAAASIPPAPPVVLPAEVPTLAPVVPTAVPVVPTAVPAVIPVVQPVAPARPGPAGVVNKIPNSAWRWLDAHNWTVEWRQGPGPARVSEAQYATNTIVIWYDTARSDTFWAGAFGHELGHAVSWVHFSDVQTSEWNAQRGFATWRWVPGMPNDFHVGEGDFAEAFMGYLFGHQIRSQGGPLSQADRAWIAANTPF